MPQVGPAFGADEITDSGPASVPIWQAIDCPETFDDAGRADRAHDQEGNQNRPNKDCVARYLASAAHPAGRARLREAIAVAEHIASGEGTSTDWDQLIDYVAVAIWAVKSDAY